MNRIRGLDRRDFLKTGAAGLAALPLAGRIRGAVRDGAADPARIPGYRPDMRYRPVGDTGAWLSVFSLGAFAVTDPVFRYLFEHGVNTVHVSPQYMEGASIRALGKLIKGRRDQVYVCVKDEYDHIDDALRALDSDYIDFLMFNRHGKPVATDPKIGETVERLRGQGKVRWAGLTCHGDVLNAAAAGVDCGLYQLVMPLTSPANYAAMRPTLDRALSRGVGIMAMKYSWGLPDPALEIAQFKKVVADPAVTTAIRGLRSFDDAAAYVRAVREAFTDADRERLERHAASGPAADCTACSACAAACPAGLDLPTLFRCDQYYRLRPDAPRLIAEAAAASPGRLDVFRCSGCGACGRACPSGTAGPGRAAEAARRIGLA